MAGKQTARRPSLDNLVKQVDSHYTLVMLAARRARQLQDETDPDHVPLVEQRGNKPITVALQEVEAGKLSYQRVETIDGEDE